MKMFIRTQILIAGLVLGAVAQASSFTCTEINGTKKISFDEASKSVQLSTAEGETSFALVNVRNAADQITLTARSADAGYMLAYVLPNEGQSTIQTGGGYFYGHCDIK